jgi:hypothetical protein
VSRTAGPEPITAFNAKSFRRTKFSEPKKNGRHGRIRTCNRRIRNPMLYPFELRALNNLQTPIISGGCSGGC